MPNYTIKLTPLGDFFFGTEKMNDENGSAFFHVKSNLYPQQTTILGLLRYVLLLEANFPDHNHWNELSKSEKIGHSSFNSNAPLETFGVIQSISALYFINGDKQFHFAPYNIAYDVIEKNDELVLKDYRAKLGNLNSQITSFNSSSYDLAKIIKHKTNVGNAKSISGASTELSFYIQENYHFVNGDWSFAVNVSISDLAPSLKDFTCFVPFGGEKREFKVEFVEEMVLNCSNFELNQKVYALYLLSDAFLKADEIKTADIAINKVVSFRNLISNADMNNFTNLSRVKNDHNPYRSILYNLCSRGSVFYFSDKEKRNCFATLLDTKIGSNIGFNKYEKIN